MSKHRVRVDGGKYEFVHHGGWKLDVRRHGEQWVENLDAPKAVTSMMYELDAARVVLSAVRAVYARLGEAGAFQLPPSIIDALHKHASLVDDNEPPSEWTGVPTP